MRAAQSGDRDALDALLRRHYDRLHALCRRLTGNEADALDATQESLIAITRGLVRFDGRAAFSTWAHRVATNACLDELRRRSRRPVPGLPARDDGGFEDVEARGPSAIDGVPDRMAIDTALALVPERFRIPVVLRDVCDLGYADIAGTLGIPPGTVRSRIARGRAILAGLLGPGNQATEADRPSSEGVPPPRAQRPLPTRNRHRDQP